jgi:hypothetical protein
VVHHLEQHVEDIGVRLLDLVEQEDRVRLLRDRLGQEAASGRSRRSSGGAPISRLTAWRPCTRSCRADQVDAEDEGELFGDSRSSPTPVGPLNRNEPIGLSGRRRPERAPS